MKHISPTLQTLYSDLVQQIYSASEKPGSVYTQTSKGAKYLYVKYPVGATRRDAYLGPADDPGALARAGQIRAEHRNARERRRIVRALRDSAVPAPTRTLGRVLDAISDAGLFGDAVLVGTSAYICYSAVIGVVLPAAALTTQDVDLATASLAISADGGASSMLDIVKRADDSFLAVPGLKKGSPPSSFRSKTGFLVDLLTPQRHRDDENPMPLNNLRAGAVPLQHLDWLIDEPVRAVALHGAGVAICLPQPAKYAVHKLIVAQKRSHHERLKRGKDLMQAKALIEALSETDPHSLDDALDDAFSKGTRGWKSPALRSLKELEIDPSKIT